jgi:transcriptional regulator with XRE-family HTH domain
VAVTIIKKIDTRPPLTKWGVEIRRIRESQGLSQRGLAKLAQVNRSSLRRFETNGIGGTISLIERLADVLGYELDLLCRGFVDGLRLAPEAPTVVAAAA